MLRKASLQDVSRIAEIIVFGKRVAYRPIFNNDFVSFHELQVMDIVEEYRGNPALLENMIVFDDGILKGVINRKITGNTIEICEFYVEPFFKGQGVGRQLLQHVISEANGFQSNGETCLIEGTTKIDMCYDLRL